MRLGVLPRADFGKFLLGLGERSHIFLPAVVNDRAWWQRWPRDREPQPAFEKIRPVIQHRGFLLPVWEALGTGRSRSERVPVEQVLVGVKACDLHGIRCHDRMYLDGDFVDPAYESRRRRLLLIAADCPAPAPTCFCTYMGLAPFAAADAGADLGLSVVSAGYLLESFTRRGNRVLEQAGSLLGEAPAEAVAERDASRVRARAVLARQTPGELDAGVGVRIASRHETAFWQEVADDCVECQGCQQACMTCYCFLLADQPRDSSWERVRTWDHCYFPAYARVGGGLNPRAEWARRFRNRFECKYQAFHENFGIFACSGCGRCIAGCTARIDIREILRRL